MRVLGITVGETLRDNWVRWLAPGVQPFFVESLRPWPRGVSRQVMGPELSDTYRGWRLSRSLEVIWLDEDAFFELPRQGRAELVRAQVRHGRGAVPTVGRWSDLLDPEILRAQADGRRFVWWPSLLAANGSAVLSRVVGCAPDGAEVQSLPSRHGEATAGVWSRCAAVLPAARRLAGSFPACSGPNCFSTVLAASGVPAVENASTSTEAFLDWLASACRLGGDDGEVGTVLVWRVGDGRPVHAAVTIGGGWALEKASQEWWTPRAIRRVGEVVKAARGPGQRLTRHRIV